MLKKSLFLLSMCLSTQVVAEDIALLEKTGIDLLQKGDNNALSYLIKAAENESPLANNIMGYLTFLNAENNADKQKESFQYFWRGILKGCTSAQENLGLFQLYRMKKIDFTLAKDKMKENLYSCDPIKQEVNAPKIDTTLLACQCQSVLQDEERFMSKAYVLLDVYDGAATLKSKSGDVFTIKKDDILPDNSKIIDVRKTAVILAGSNGVREILNLYVKPKCVDFCQDMNITQNLTADEMRAIVNKSNDVVIKPYRITFTPKECETIKYYAPALIDTSLSFVGKQECFGGVVIEAPSNAKIVGDSTGFNINPADVAPLSLKNKEQLREIGKELLEK